MYAKSKLVDIITESDRLWLEDLIPSWELGTWIVVSSMSRGGFSILVSSIANVETCSAQTRLVIATSGPLSHQLRAPWQSMHCQPHKNCYAVVSGSEMPFSHIPFRWTGMKYLNTASSCPVCLLERLEVVDRNWSEDLSDPRAGWRGVESTKAWMLTKDLE